MFYDEKVVNIRNTSIAAPVKQTHDINSLFVRKIISFMRVREYGPSKGLVEIANLFRDRLIRSRQIEYYSTKLEKSGFEIVSIEQYEVHRQYQSVQEIINITKSFPFIECYSKKDEETISESLNGNCNITSDPFILVAKKQER